MRSPRLTIFALIVLIVVLVFGDSLSHGRAGGGGGYSGGSSSSSGGFSGGGSSFSGGGRSGRSRPMTKTDFVIFLVVIAIVVVVSLMKKANHRKREKFYANRRVESDQRHRIEALGILQEHDHDFDANAFFARMNTAFFKIQEAWCQQDLTSVRPFISDGIYERFSLQTEEQKSLGFRDHMENIQVQRIAFATASYEEPFDVVTVCIDASATDYRVSLATGKPVSRKSTEQFTEYWSYLRRRGAKTLTSNGLIEGNCPNCGADISMNQAAKCQSCDSLLRSGQYDWVLCEITQACEWRPDTATDIPGLTGFRRSADPTFNTQHIEDLASVVFWRKAIADHRGQISPLQKVASDEFCEAYARSLKPNASGSRSFYGDCAVGAVLLRAILPADDENEDHRALVEVRWSGKSFESENGEMRALDDGRLFRHILVLSRQRGVRSDIGSIVSSAHCPGCGAPESDSASNSCEFCGQVLNDGSRNWVLTDLLTVHEAQPLIEQAQSAGASVVDAEVVDAVAVPAASDEPAPEGTALLGWLIKVAMADSNIDKRELRALSKVAESRHISKERLDILVDAARHRRLDVPEPRDDQEARKWLTAAADMSLLDGDLSRAEVNLLRDAGSRLGLVDFDIKALIKQRMKRMRSSSHRGGGNRKKP